MSSIHERLGVPNTIPFVEATTAHPDPFFSRPLAVKVTSEDVKEAKRKNHGSCAIACAVKNSSQAEAILVQSRMVYLLRTHPNGKRYISKHQLTAAGARLVRQFDKTGKVPSQLIEIRPMAVSHTKEARSEKRGTGVPHAQGHRQKRPKRPVWLRTRLSPKMAPQN